MLKKINTYLQRDNRSRSLKFWGVLLVFSIFSLFAMGRSGGDTISYGVWLYLSLYVLKRLNNRIFVSYVIFVFIIAIISLPASLLYGRLDLGVIASLFETNPKESAQFLSDIGIKNYLFTFLYIAIFTYLLKLNKSTYYTIVKTKKFYVLCIFLIISIVENPISQTIRDYQRGKVFGISNAFHTNYYPFKQIYDTQHFIVEYFKNKEFIKQAQTRDPQWNIISVKQPYDIYVLVIGESVRRDYMSAYGYKINSTPFLSTVNGIFFNNFISPAPNTRLSLERMLYQYSNTNTRNTNYARTPITLAKAANMDTYWFSNQGKYGYYDVLASTVGSRADTIQFIDNDVSSQHKTSDLELLPYVNQILIDNHNKINMNKKKLIVLHLAGSHPPACERLSDDYNIKNIENYISKDISCYLSSNKQTDKLLQQIYDRLQAKKQTFSIMYLADHGLSHRHQIITGWKLTHSFDKKQNYEIPLIILSSDSQSQTYIDAQKSGFQFINAVAEWLGIAETSLTLKQPFFSADTDKKPIKVFNGRKLVEYNSLEEDPVKIEE